MMCLINRLVRPAAQPSWRAAHPPSPIEANLRPECSLHYFEAAGICRRGLLPRVQKS